VFLSAHIKQAGLDPEALLTIQLAAKPKPTSRTTQGGGLKRLHSLRQIARTSQLLTGGYCLLVVALGDQSTAMGRMVGGNECKLSSLSPIKHLVLWTGPDWGSYC